MCVGGNEGGMSMAGATPGAGDFGGGALFIFLCFTLRSTWSCTGESFLD